MLKCAPSSGDSLFSARYNSWTELFCLRPAVNSATGRPDSEHPSNRRQRKNGDDRSARENGAKAASGMFALFKKWFYRVIGLNKVEVISIIRRFLRFLLIIRKLRKFYDHFFQLKWIPDNSFRKAVKDIEKNFVGGW